MRDTARDLGEIVALSDRRVRKAIQPATDPLQLSRSVKPEQVFSRNPETFDVPGADDWRFSCECQHAI
jgi:ABC-type oligopeptide transport system substrate-binding subunit